MVLAAAEIAKPSYEGMPPLSVPLWRQFLPFYADKFESFEYNVRVGQGLDPGPGATPEMQRMWKMVTTKRIDVVANRQDQTWVIEVEPRPGLRTFGQIVAYMSLLPKYYPVRPTVIGALVCQYIGYDMFGLFREQDHFIFAFPPGKKPNLPPQFLPSVSSTDYQQQSR
jgi:hypothetical protein